MSMMDKMMDRMGKEEKGAMMDGMMDKFFADMSADDKSKMMAEMMPRRLTIMLPKESRIGFVSKMVATLVEQGSAGMSEEEKRGLRAMLTKTIDASGSVRHVCLPSSAADAASTIRTPDLTSQRSFPEHQLRLHAQSPVRTIPRLLFDVGYVCLRSH